MRSDMLKEGPSRAPHRSLLKALSITDSEMKRPFVAVVNSYSEYIPGHMHLREIGEAVKAGIRNAGGVPFEFQTRRVRRSCHEPPRHEVLPAVP